MKKILLHAFLILMVLPFSCRVYRFSAEITESDLYRHLDYFAADALKGRSPGSAGDVITGKYLQEKFRKLDIPVQRQDFSFVQSYRRGPDNFIRINGQEISPSAFTPAAFSKDTMVKAPLVFAGYGITIDTDSFKWDDYKGLDIKNKWVLVMRGAPDIPGGNEYFSMGSDDRDKAMLARDNGAAGILFVSGMDYDRNDILPEITGKQASAGMAALHVTRPVADILLAAVNSSVQKIEKEFREDQKPAGCALPVTVQAQSAIDHVMGNTSNWIAILAGSDPVLRNEYIVIGAHSDHLGMGGPGSSSRRPDTVAVHNGADDNASGLSAMLEIAGKLKSMQPQLKRSVIFVAFGAEEMGLLGSKFFVNHPPVDLKQINVMVNLDMVGRLDTTRGIQVGGTGTSTEADSLTGLSKDAVTPRLVLSREGSGPSDHSSFYGKDIPVFFITTGAHTDYHTPDDDAGRINFQGLKIVSEFACRLVVNIDQAPGALTFREAGPRESPTANYRFKVTLGFMPDFSAEDIGGVRVDFVSRGKAAERGGIKNGDIITAIDGMAVKNIYDYMYRLTKLSKNQIISVEILRNGGKEILIIQL